VRIRSDDPLTQVVRPGEPLVFEGGSGARAGEGCVDFRLEEARTQADGGGTPAGTLEALEAQKAAALERQDYESCTRLRDEIKALAAAAAAPAPAPTRESDGESESDAEDSDDDPDRVMVLPGSASDER
jgi:hypothetical protein